MALAAAYQRVCKTSPAYRDSSLPSFVIFTILCTLHPLALGPVMISGYKLFTDFFRPRRAPAHQPLTQQQI